MSQWRALHWRAIGTSAACAVGVAALGTTVTDLGPWYQNLKKPEWQPPGPVFGMVWTTIYALTATSAVLAWQRIRDGNARLTLLGLYAANGFLNILWSLLFFRLQRPDWAIVEVVPFWLSVLALMMFLWDRHRLASLLLLPYLLWVVVAALLNLAILTLNGPFG